MKSTNLSKSQKIFSFFDKILVGASISIIKFYQKYLSLDHGFLGKLLIGEHHPKICRFEPSCSYYSLEALKKYGFIKGGFLSLKRILHCNPFFQGGIDKVI